MTAIQFGSGFYVKGPAAEVEARLDAAKANAREAGLPFAYDTNGNESRATAVFADGPEAVAVAQRRGYHWIKGTFDAAMDVFKCAGLDVQGLLEAGETHQEVTAKHTAEPLTFSVAG